MKPSALRTVYRALRDRSIAASFDALSRWAGRRSIVEASESGARLGDLAFDVVSRQRRLALESLSIAFPELSEERRNALARESFRHLGRSLMEILRIVDGEGRELTSIVRWKGKERLAEAMARGRGVVLVTGHCGNWELLGAATVAAGFPLTVVARGMKDPAVQERAMKIRERGGLATAVRESADSARQLLGALRSGGCLGFLIDQDIDVDGAFVPFFGRPAWTATGAALLAVRRKTPLLPILSRRLSPSEHEIEVFDEIVPREGISADESARELTAKSTEVIERWIRKNPEQWVWMHRRWKRQSLSPTSA